MIGYAGLSHLGVVSSAAAADKRFDVVAYDPDAALCANLAAGRTAVIEPGLADLLARVRDRLQVTSDAAALAQCEVIYISADVPTTDDHRSDVTPVRDLIATVARAAAPSTSIVILSQVAPGFTRSLRETVESGYGRPLSLFYQVETLAFGTAVGRALHPERFIIGCADPGAALPAPLARFLDAFGCPVLPMRYESAELCKISINMFLAASLSTTNMLAEICEAIGAEWREIVPALRLDRRIGQHAYLDAGLGIGGGNITRDMATIQHLAREHGSDAQLVDVWAASSAYRRDWALRTLHRESLSRIAAPVIALWGLAYKENTGVTKNSPALALTSALEGATIRAFDPEVDAHAVAGLVACGDALDACAGADALAVMTPWPQFAGVDLHEVRRRMRGRLIVDPVGRLDGPAAAALGFDYWRLGTGVPRAMETAARC